MTETLPSPTAAADAPDFAEYKRRRQEKNTTPQPVDNSADSPADGATPASDAKAESGSVSETGTEAQKTEDRSQKPKKDRSLDGRISELTNKLKTAEEGRLKLERELEELRKGNRNPAAPPQQKAETETPRAAAAEEEPDLEKLMEQAIRDPQNTTYEKAQAAALKEYHRAMREFENRKSERERSAHEAKTAHETRLARTRERHTDFDEVVAAAIPQVEGVHNAGMEAAMASFDTADVVYYFATHLEELRRIAQLKPQAAYRETVALDLKLASASSEKPETKAPAASRAPAPPRTVPNTTAHVPKSAAEARDYAEYKRLRAGRN